MNAPGRAYALTDDPDLPARLREALATADYTYRAVEHVLGEQAMAALHRNETTPAALRLAGERSDLATLIRLFVLARPVPAAPAHRALPGLVPPLLRAGVLAEAGEDVRAALDVRPYQVDERDLWIVADLTPGLDGKPTAVSSDYVLGVTGASTSLARLTVRQPVNSALDLGTGCGVQALHLAAHAGRVVATDVNERALAIARLNLALNGIEDADVRCGSLFEPVAGQRFDLITSNPPFVISPPGQPLLTYRDAGMPGDTVVEHIVRTAPDLLTDGGWCQLVANWAVPAGEPWDRRLRSWLPQQGVDALVVQREVLDPAQYAEVWLRDAGANQRPDYRARYEHWLRWFDEQGIGGVGFGWINLHRRAGPRPVHRFVDQPYEVDQPVAAAVAEFEQAAAVLGGTTDPLNVRVRRSADVVQETVGVPGAPDPRYIVLRRTRGLRPARTVGTLEAGLVAAADGELTAEQLLTAVAALTGQELVADQARETVRDLVVDGFLRVPGPGA
ncbi:MAG: transferase [Micrococcales bacterium]|nr:MAG: transferase [Micrococcales bacterium]PIE26152.1 MAG: transferase [Micrococcales bacterium]